MTTVQHTRATPTAIVRFGPSIIRHWNLIRHLSFVIRHWKQAALALLLTPLLAVAAWQSAIRLLPPVEAHYPRGATLILDKTGTECAAFVGQEDAWFVPLKSEEISPWLKKAIVAVEDRRFYDHAGVDWQSVAGAAWQDAASLRIVRGASTLDMQVARLRNPQPRSWWNKLTQAIHAEQIDRSSPKDAILTEYINRAPFGGNLVGAGAASWKYFGKQCRDLSLGEAALLAGLPQSPNRFRPDRNPTLAAKRRDHVLQQMKDANLITDADLARASAEPIAAAWRELPQESHHGYGALPTLADLAIRNPGTTITTTIDRATQLAAWNAAHEKLAALSASGVDSVAVIIADVHTAEIKAAVSLSNQSPSLDLTRAARSTGSVLKPFLYASAFQAGILTPTTLLDDSPKAWAGYLPTNFDKDFRGRMTAADALAQSRNIPAMIVLSKVGVDRAIGELAQVGIKTPESSQRRYGLSLAIGGAEATPWEIAEAYATLARGGIHRELHIAADDETTAQESRVFAETICWKTLNCINSPSRTRSIEGADTAATLHAAWKTGTSNGLRDAWCAAATPRLVVVVWCGNSSGRGSSSLIGQDAAAPLALHLIGTLDPGGPSWPETPTPDSSKTTLATANRLSVVSPAPNTQVLLTSEQQSQPVALQSAGGTGEHRWWFANGQLVGDSNHGEKLWWQATAGSYELRVVDESGHGATMKVRVR